MYSVVTGKKSESGIFLQTIVPLVRQEVCSKRGQMLTVLLVGHRKDAKTAQSVEDVHEEVQYQLKINVAPSSTI